MAGFEKANAVQSGIVYDVLEETTAQAKKNVAAQRRKTAAVSDVNSLLAQAGLVTVEKGKDIADSATTETTSPANSSLAALMDMDIARKKRKQDVVDRVMEDAKSRTPYAIPSSFETAYHDHAPDGARAFVEGRAKFISNAELNRTQVKNDGPLRVAAYIRVSSERPEQEDSYETQERYFSGMLEKNPDWISAGVYSDHGVSGTLSEKRTGFKRLMRHCKEGKIDRIVCKSISRFSRNTADFVMALRVLKENGVTILFEKEALDTADAYSDFIVTTLGAIAQEETRSTSSNILWSNQKRFPNGHVCNKDIYGYRFAEGEDEYYMTPTGYRMRRLLIVEEEAEVVRRIFDAFCAGETCPAIATMLNREKIPKPILRKTRVRKRSGMLADGQMREDIDTGWTARHIRNILKLERYTGDVFVQKTITTDFLTHSTKKNEGELPQYIVREHHPAIISREVFERAKGLRELSQMQNGSPRNATMHAFSSRIVCGHCGRYFTVHNTGANAIWKCPNTKLNNGMSVCHAEQVYEEQIVRMTRKAVAERFRLVSVQLHDDVEVADIMSGRYEGREAPLTDRATSFVRQMLDRLENIQNSDFVERDRAFLKQQIAVAHSGNEIMEKKLRKTEGLLDTLRIRRNLLNDAQVSDTAIVALEESIARDHAELAKGQEEEGKLAKRLEYLEDYWDLLEDDYEWREKAIEWMKTLPAGHEGVVMFLNGLTDEYAKAFLLSVTMHSPFRFTVHWFDDTRTEVTMDTNVEDYRYTAQYFDGQRMREKKPRRRKRQG